MQLERSAGLDMGFFAACRKVCLRVASKKSCACKHAQSVKQVAACNTSVKQSRQAAFFC